MSVLSASYMHDEAAAFAHVKSIIWASGTVCPYCGVVDRAYKLEGVRSKASKKNPEGVERHGLWKCRECRGQFTVRKGTIFEESHPLRPLEQSEVHSVRAALQGHFVPLRYQCKATPFETSGQPIEDDDGALGAR